MYRAGPTDFCRCWECQNQTEPGAWQGNQVMLDCDCAPRRHGMASVGLARRSTSARGCSTCGLFWRKRLPH